VTVVGVCEHMSRAGSSPELVQTVFVRPHEIKGAVKVQLMGGKECMPEYAPVDPSAPGFVMTPPTSDERVRVHVPSMFPGGIPHGVSVSCALCKRSDDVFGPLVLYKSAVSG
jgi:hypothetical protein